MHSSQPGANPARKLLKLIGGAALLTMAIFVITVPLDLASQWIFGAGVIVAGISVARLKSRRATLAICVLALLASTRYMFWRTTQTLDFGTPLELFLGMGLYIAEVYAWLILVLGFLQTSWPIRRLPMELTGPDQALPTVDVYIPTYNESLAIVRSSVLAAMTMDYPRDRFRVFLLDDGRRPEFETFAAEAGCGYLTRPDNLHAKAGNLNAAMKRTDGELICVFDCDHVPTRAFLQMTVGWFQKDTKLAVLQTPHYFYSPDPIQRNLIEVDDMPGEGELFYGTVQSGNDLWNATFFCGSCAIIRRTALEETGGFAGETVTEDAHTALKLQRLGWNTAYINIRLSAGLATERLSQHIGQRVRWARGMTQILRIDNPLLGRGLSWPQRLCYLNAMLHFQFPLPRFVFLTAPLAYLLLGQNLIEAPADVIFAYALPHLFNAMRSSLRLQGADRRMFWGEIYETLLTFHLLKPTIWTLFDPSKGKFNVTGKGELLNEDFFDDRVLRPHLVTAGLLVAGIAIGFLKLLRPDLFAIDMGALFLNVAWSMFSLLILISAISIGRETRQIRGDVRIDARLPVTVYFDDGHVVDGQTVNASFGGLGIEIPPGFEMAGRQITDVALPGREPPVTLPAQAISVSPGHARVRFGALTLAQHGELVRALMGRANAWEEEERKKPDGAFRSIADLLRISAGAMTYRRAKGSRSRKAMAITGAPVAMIAASMVAGVLAGSAVARPVSNGIGVVSGEGPGGTRWVRIPFRAMGVANDVELRGAQPEIGIDFGMRDDEVATSANVTLTFPGAARNAGTLMLSLNGEPVRPVTLPQSGGAGAVVRIPFDPAYLLPGRNRLTLRLRGASSRVCAYPQGAGARLGAAGSHLDIATQRLPAQPDLSRLPAPFFNGWSLERLTLPFVFAQSPSTAELEAAGAVSSWIGSLASFRGFRFPASFGKLPPGDAIVFVIQGQAISGLERKIGGPTIATVRNPRDPLGSLLLVMGRDEAELKIAAAALASGSKLSGQSALVRSVRLPHRQPYDAPRWLPADRPVPLRGIADPQTLQRQGVEPRPFYASFRMPPDLFFWPHGGVPMKLDYRYPDAGWLGMSFNGRGLDSVVLSGKRPWSRIGPDMLLQHKGRVTLPNAALSARNELNIVYGTRSNDEGRCEGVRPPAAIGPDSTIDLRGSYHYARLPDLAMFAKGGFPFTRIADLGETTVVLTPRPTPVEVTAFLGLMGHIGDSTGLAATGLTVASPNERAAFVDRDVIVIGPVSIAAMPLFRDAPVQPDGSRLRATGPHVRQRVAGFLASGTGDWNTNADAALGASPGFQGAISFESADSPGRSVVALLASAPGQLPDLVEAIAGGRAGGVIGGDLSVMNEGQMKSFRIGSSFWSGSAPIWVAAGYWFSERPLLLVVFTIVIALVLSGPLALFLHGRERQRLTPAGEQG